MIVSQVLSKWNDRANWSLRDEPGNATEYKEFLSWDSDEPIPSWSELEKLWPTVQAEIAAEAQAKIDAKASAVAKLQALGLTVDEVQVAFGISASV